MIFDTLEQATPYFAGEWWREVLRFIAAAPLDLPAGERALRGEDLFVRVLDFVTGPQADAVLESHRKYNDVHVVLQGSELIRVWPAATLSVRQEYDADKDVMFYEPPPVAPLVLDLRPGHFVVFQPQDAHMPAIAAPQPARIRKLVFKVSTRLIVQGAQ